MRKRKIKKILTLLLMGILLLMSMGGCGKDTETGKTQVAMIVKSTGERFLEKRFCRCPGGSYGIQSECYV